MRIHPEDTKLINAVLAGDLAAAQAALANGADQDSADGLHRTALQHAAGRGDLAMMTLLLGKNADVNLTDEEGFSPLHAAIEKKHFPAVDLLLAHKANINLQEGDKRLTPLHVAFNVDLNEERTDRVIYLLEKGADETLKNANGHDVMRMGDDYSKRFPFAGEMVTYIEEFAKLRELRARQAVEEAERARLQAFNDAAHGGLTQDVTVRRIQIKPRPQPGKAPGSGL